MFAFFFFKAKCTLDFVLQLHPHFVMGAHAQPLVMMRATSTKCHRLPVNFGSMRLGKRTFTDRPSCHRTLQRLRRHVSNPQRNCHNSPASTKCHIIIRCQWHHSSELDKDREHPRRAFGKGRVKAPIMHSRAHEYLQGLVDGTFRCWCI